MSSCISLPHLLLFTCFSLGGFYCKFHCFYSQFYSLALDKLYKFSLLLGCSKLKREKETDEKKLQLLLTVHLCGHAKPLVKLQVIHVTTREHSCAQHIQCSQAVTTGCRHVHTCMCPTCACFCMCLYQQHIKAGEIPKFNSRFTFVFR